MVVFVPAASTKRLGFFVLGHHVAHVILVSWVFVVRFIEACSRRPLGLMMSRRMMERSESCSLVCPVCSESLLYPWFPASFSGLVKRVLKLAAGVVRPLWSQWKTNHVCCLLVSSLMGLSFFTIACLSAAWYCLCCPCHPPTTRLATFSATGCHFWPTARCRERLCITPSPAPPPRCALRRSAWQRQGHPSPAPRERVLPLPPGHW